MTLSRLGPTPHWFKRQFSKATCVSIVIAVVFSVLGVLAGLFGCEILELFGNFDVAACNSCAEVEETAQLNQARKTSYEEA